MGAQAFLTTLFLLSGQWIAFVLNVPLVAYNANKYVPRSLTRAESSTITTCSTQPKSSGRS